MNASPPLARDEAVERKLALDAPLLVSNPRFEAWRDSHPRQTWARIDLSAARLGFEWGLVSGRSIGGQPSFDAWFAALPEGYWLLKQADSCRAGWDGAQQLLTLGAVSHVPSAARRGRVGAAPALAPDPQAVTADTPSISM